MKGLFAFSRLLALIYSFIILALGFFFLTRDQFVMRTIRGEVPMDFYVRFGAFWFISFVLALLFFFFHLLFNKYYYTDAELTQSTMIGKMAFVVGTGAAAIAVIVFVSL